MKVKVLWGFVGDAAKLGTDSTKVKAGQVFDKVDDEYAHTLIGKGLVEEVAGDAKSKNTKQAAPAENK